MAAHTSASEGLVRIPRKLTAADHSTPITEYDLSLHALTKQYIAFQTANSKNFKFFQTQKNTFNLLLQKYFFLQLFIKLLLYDHEPFFSEQIT